MKLVSYSNGKLGLEFEDAVTFGHDTVADDVLSCAENQDNWGEVVGPRTRPRLTLSHQQAIEDAQWERASNARLNAKADRSDQRKG